MHRRQKNVNRPNARFSLFDNFRLNFLFCAKLSSSARMAHICAAEICRSLANLIFVLEACKASTRSTSPSCAFHGNQKNLSSERTSFSVPIARFQTIRKKIRRIIEKHQMRASKRRDTQLQLILNSSFCFCGVHSNRCAQSIHLRRSRGALLLAMRAMRVIRK